MSEESKIPAPVNPLTLKVNLTILKYVSSNFFKKFLPKFVQVLTSDIRTAEHNLSVGGVPNSAHVHGLAEDFQLKYTNGNIVPQIQALEIFNTVIKPNWSGFSEFEKASSGEGYHIHWQLSRDISTYTGIIALAALGVVGYSIISKWEKGGT